MQTLTDRLKLYCNINGKELPYGRHIHGLGIAVSRYIKDAGKENCIEKTTEDIVVNGYSDEAIPMVDKVIKEYFVDKNKLLRSIRVDPPYFNYSVKEASAFEEALKKLKIPILDYSIENGIYNYRLPKVSPVILIELGKIFYKKRLVLEKLNKYK